MLTAIRCEKGDLGGNLARHYEMLDRAASAACDLVVLPEMSLTGSDPTVAVTLEDGHVADLVRASRDAPALCFGLSEVARDGEPDRRPMITQVLAGAGRVLQVHRKAGVAPDEQEAYQSGDGSAPLELSGISLTLALCAEIGIETAYRTKPTVVLGPSAPGLYGPRRHTPEDWRRGFQWWRTSVVADATRLLPANSYLAVSTQARATVDEDFPGWCALVAAGGRVVAELPDWREGCLVVDVA
jgi:predicted amidohydrolase